MLRTNTFLRNTTLNIFNRQLFKVSVFNSSNKVGDGFSGGKVKEKGKGNEKDYINKEESTLSF